MQYIPDPERHCGQSPWQSLLFHHRKEQHDHCPSEPVLLHEEQFPGRSTAEPESCQIPSLWDDNDRYPSAEAHRHGLQQSLMQTLRNQQYRTLLQCRIPWIPHRVLPGFYQMAETESAQ